jgi:HAD superfamily hydrolase (TIGR01509 family)
VTISGILFDIGDTLLPASRLQRDVLATTATTLALEGLIPDATSFIRAYEIADGQPELDDLADLNHLYSDRRIVERACTFGGAAYTSQLVSRFIDTYRTELRRAIRPAWNLAETLQRLRTLGPRLGIASDGTTSEQHDQLRLLGIADLFDPIVISQEVGMRKPDPRMLWVASTRWNVPPGTVLVVGDRPDRDVAGARAAGMQSALTIEFVDLRDRMSAALLPTFIIRALPDLVDIAR